MSLLPAVTNALNAKRIFKMGPRADGVVDRLRRSNKELKERLEQAKKEIDQLQQANNQLNDRDDKRNKGEA